MEHLPKTKPKCIFCLANHQLLIASKNTMHNKDWLLSNNKKYDNKSWDVASPHSTHLEEKLLKNDGNNSGSDNVNNDDNGILILYLLPPL